MTLGSRSIEVSTATIRDWARFIQTSMDTRETRLETGDNFAAQGTEWEFGLFRTTRIAAGEHAMSCNVAQRQGQGTPARLHALFQISGEALVHKPGRCQRFRPGEWSLNTDGRDYRVEYFGDVQQIVLQIPWDSVAGYRNLLDPMSRTVFRFDEGIGQVFFRFLEAACETEAGRSTTATVALSGMAMQLFQATVFELSGQNASGAARAEFAERLFAEIRAQLANPALSVELLAQRLGCSKGYLHRAFRGSGLPGRNSRSLRWRWQSADACAGAGDDAAPRDEHPCDRLERRRLRLRDPQAAC